MLFRLGQRFYVMILANHAPFQQLAGGRGLKGGMGCRVGEGKGLWRVGIGMRFDFVSLVFPLFRGGPGSVGGLWRRLR